MTEIFDTHAHYDDEAFDEDRETLLESLPENGIAKVVNVGASLASCGRTIELMKRYGYIYGAIGIHPNETGGLSEASIDWLRQQCRLEKCVAVGEIGLDYYWDEPAREIQKEWFARQLCLARELKKPVIIHSREAAKDTVEITQALKAGENGGIVHCYSYSKELAVDFLNMGFSFGIGGVITFKNSKKIKEVVEYLPMDRILLETDCPYLSPVPNRGKRNSSLNLPYVVQAISEIKGIESDRIIEITENNAKRLFGI